MIIYDWFFILKNYKIKGVVHIGANKCEELDFYKSLKIDNIIWIDANTQNSNNILEYLVADIDDKEYCLNISNDNESTSILNYSKNQKYSPNIYITEKKIILSKTIDTIYNIHNIDYKSYNMWFISIQGAELLALKGGIKNINNIDIICIKIYTQKIYENCPLITDIDNFLHQYNFTRIITEITESSWGFGLFIKKMFVNSINKS